MRKGFVYILTAVLLTGLLFCCLLFEEEMPVTLYAELTSDGSTEVIYGWENGEGACFFFLPSYGSMEQLRLRTNAPGRFFLDDQPVKNGTSCSEWDIERTYILTDKQEDRQIPVTFVRSESVPALYLDVSSGSMDYIHQERGNEETGAYRLYAADGELTHKGSVAALNGRGNASWWGHEKKPYSLKLAAEADFLGMGKAKKWILLANAMDHSNMKNKSVLDFGKEAGLQYTADCEWVDLYLNGEYTGLYLLCERNEIHQQRVDIPQENTFLVSLELESRLIKREYPYIRTQAGQALRIHQQYLETADMQALWQSAENAILAPNSVDPVTGKHLLELIDLESWVRKYLLEEVFANVDACSISQFFYADGSGKIYAGPAWDYDGAMGNFVPESLFGNRVQACEGKPLPWFSTLYRKDFFIEKVKQLYAAEFRPLLSQLLSEKLDDYADRIQMASRMNSIRWAGTDMLPEVEAIKTYMEARMAFLDNLWISERPYCIVYADLGPDMNGVNYAVVPGGMLPPLPEYTDSDTTDYHGWYIKNTGEPFDNAMPIFEDMEIFLKQTSLTAQTSDDAVLPETDYEASEEPVSVVRLLPGMVFGGMLVLLFLLDRQKRKTGGQ